MNTTEKLLIELNNIVVFSADEYYIPIKEQLFILEVPAKWEKMPITCPSFVKFEFTDTLVRLEFCI